MERGIDKLEVGHLFVMGMAGMMDENFHPGENQKENILAEVDKRVRIPAIILAKNKTKYTYTYDVGFWTRTNKGEMSGMMIMKNICIWRYFSSDVVQEGTPPNWILDTLSKDILEEVNIKDMFYMKSKDGNPENDYKFFPYI